MKVLVINSGSSSLKFDVFEFSDGVAKGLFKGLVEGIGESAPKIRWKAGDTKFPPTDLDAPDHTAALTIAIEHIQKALTPDGPAFMPDAIGHRVVHGGHEFSSQRIDERILATIEEYAKLAPLHNPANLLGIRACMKLFPNTPNVAVFDTSFHAGMPAVARTYPLPKELTEKYEIYRYGFHGTSHRFVSQECARFLNRPLEELKIITCHLGNGGSLAAVKNGRSIDTTMGFTPLEGIMMGTRTGDIDAGAVLFLMEKENLSTKEINTILNKKSGLLGVSGMTNDMRPIEEAMLNDNDDLARFTLELFAYKVKRHLGALSAALGGVDALVFTAGVGENSDVIREMVCDGLRYLGIELDAERNRGRKGENTLISTDAAACKVCVIPTDEERMIARDTVEVLSKN